MADGERRARDAAPQGVTSWSLAKQGGKSWGPLRQARAARILKRAVQRPEASPAEFWLPLRFGEELSVEQALDVCVVRGGLQVWGFTLQPSTEFQRLVGARWSSLPRLRAVRGAPLQDQEQDGAGGNLELRAFLEQHRWPVVLRLRLPGRGQLGNSAALWAALLPPVSWQRLRPHPAWPSIVERFAELVVPAAGPERPPVLLVMGAKGVGKSACSRYLANGLLEALGEVCFLETDLGQPELTTPGLVALHKLRGPMLQPGSHAGPHQHELVAAFFAGGVTPSTHPVLYARCLRAAFDAYLALGAGRDGSPPPLVVNSHGWVVGLGLDCVRTLQAVVRAQLVIRIRSAREEATSRAGRPNLAARRRNALARCGPTTLALEAAAGVGAGAARPCEAVFVEVDSLAGVPPSDGKASGRQYLHAPEARWLRFVTHFRPDVDSCCSVPTGMSARDFFWPLPRVRLPLSRLRFALVTGSLEPEEIEPAFVGMVIAVCAVPTGAGGAADVTAGAAAGGESELAATDEAEAEGDSPCGGAGALGTPAVLELGDGCTPRCLAVAWVHSFDLLLGEVVLCVPRVVDATSLKEANAVLRGDISWEPHSVRGQNVRVGTGDPDTRQSPLEPYQSSWQLEGAAAGTRVQSTRQSLKRRRHMNGEPNRTHGRARRGGGI